MLSESNRLDSEMNSLHREWNRFVSNTRHLYFESNSFHGEGNTLLTEWDRNPGQGAPSWHQPVSIFVPEAVKSGGRVGRITGLARISVCEAGRDALRVIPRSMAGLVKDAGRCKQHDPRPGLLAVWTETRWRPLSCESVRA